MRGSGNYDRKKKDTVVCLTGCAVVLFFVVAGNFDSNRKNKKIQSSVGRKLSVFLLWREIFITTDKKKDTLRPEKKKIQSSVCWVRGSGDYDRKKKIQSSVCWVRGSGDYDRKKKDTVVCLTCFAVVLFFVVAGYDRKKKEFQSSVWRKKKDTVVCLLGAWF